jgi:peptidoglycan-N-acetylglucosamine deacetylase
VGISAPSESEAWQALGVGPQRKTKKESRVILRAAAAIVALDLILISPLAHREAGASSQPASGRTIALTFDDLPASQAPDDVAHVMKLNSTIVAALQSVKAPAVGFVNEGKLTSDGREGQVEALRLWIRAGLPLGNHTRSHWDLNDTPIEKYIADILEGESVTAYLRLRANMTEKWFRHPYTHTGPTKEIKDRLNAFLKRQGFTVAPFTVEHVDYLFSDRYRGARLRKDDALAKKIGTAYLAHLDTMLAFFEGLSRETFGREIAQTLLIHVNDINADYLPAMLEKMKARGYAFVSLKDAMQDAAYQTPDDYVGTAGPSWLHRWRVAKGLPSKLPAEPDPPKWVSELPPAR